MQHYSWWPRHENNMCPSIDNWIKMGYLYSMDYYSVIKKDKILPFETTSMDLETIMLSEMSDGKGQEVYDFIHMWDMK